VVAEVGGGTHLKMSPATGDTIDGLGGDVSIGAHESRTFASDGLSNWITIAGRASLGSERLTSVTALIETGDDRGAATGGAVYLGLGGREFRCDTAKNDFRQGTTDRFVFGADANVKNPDRNDPREPELTLATVDRFPVYIRFAQNGHSPWKVARVTVRLTAAGVFRPLVFSSHFHEGGVWLGTTSGAMLFLGRTTEETGLAPV
jgi:hypothetical protein